MMAEGVSIILIGLCGSDGLFCIQETIGADGNRVDTALDKEVSSLLTSDSETIMRSLLMLRPPDLIAGGRRGSQRPAG